ncbi:MAG: hypothetical protein VYA34_08395 [Myxococcota bacterium]|nr:hypothetical protein [Myxococcota bacterium]
MAERRRASRVIMPARDYGDCQLHREEIAKCGDCSRLFFLSHIYEERFFDSTRHNNNRILNEPENHAKYSHYFQGMKIYKQLKEPPRKQGRVAFTGSTPT